MNAVPAEAIREELERMLTSPEFQSSGHLKNFLRHVVEETINGRGGLIREYTLGTGVFNRGASFDPKLDNIVRTEAQKLRARLARYYETTGAGDPIRIELRKGSYSPEFRTAPQTQRAEENGCASGVSEMMENPDDTVGGRPCSERMQLDRVLGSDTFRNSESLRRLLTFLAERSILGEADDLKEYTIGIEAFGKPASYDPRQDAIVRLQAARLRQRLTEYYRTEGKDDPILIDLPKGHFRVVFQPKTSSLSSNPAVAEVSHAAPFKKIRGTRPILSTYTTAAVFVLLLVAIATGVWLGIQLRQERRVTAALRGAWTPDLELLWAPILNNHRPVVLAIGNPMFLRMPSGIFRIWSVDRPEDASASAAVSAVKKALQIPALEPSYGYVPAGEINAAFLLGKLLATRDLTVSLENSTRLSWQQVADNNVLLIGSPRYFPGIWGGLPVKQRFQLESNGVRDLNPMPGSTAFFQDHISPGLGTDGVEYAIVTHAPGPLNAGEALSFAARFTPARAGTVEYFVEPPLARQLVQRLKAAYGQVPKFYQIVLKITFRDSVPVESAFVTSCELHPNQP